MVSNVGYTESLFEIYLKALPALCWGSGYSYNPTTHTTHLCMCVGETAGVDRSGGTCNRHKQSCYHGSLREISIKCDFCNILFIWPRGRREWHFTSKGDILGPPIRQQWWVNISQHGFIFFNVHMLQDSAFGIHWSRIGQKWSKGAFKDPEMSLCGCKCTLLADQRQE